MDTIVPTVQVVEARVNPASTIKLERGSLATLKAAKKAKQDEVETAFMGDAEYKTNCFEIEKLSSRQKELKQILTDGSEKIKALKYDIRELNRSMKSHQLTLSDAIREYHETTKQLTFEGMLIVKKYELKGDSHEKNS